MRADRLLSIVLILQNRGRTTCGSLARELEVSRRTILRDVEALSFAGIPIMAEGGRGGGLSLDEAYRSGLLGLGEGELRALLLGIDGSLAADLGLGEARRLSLEKLLASRPPSLAPALDAIQRRILVDSRWWWHEEGEDAFLPELQEALLSDASVVMEYDRADGSSSRGTVDPYGLVAKSGTWYLAARRDGDYRCYRVSRIRSLRRSGEAFLRDPGFDIREWWPRNAERFAAEFMSYKFAVELPEASLKFARWIAPGRIFPKALPAGKPGWVEAEIGVDSQLHAELLILGLGGESRVLWPKELAVAVAARARAALAAIEAGPGSLQPDS
jgi:predicted DNA-binding transcriptional regulator YafY